MPATALISRKQKESPLVAKVIVDGGGFRQERRNELTCLMTLNTPLLSQTTATCIVLGFRACLLIRPPRTRRRPPHRSTCQNHGTCGGDLPSRFPLDNLFPLGDALWYSGLTHRLVYWLPLEPEARLRFVRPLDKPTPTERSEPSPADLPPCGSIVLPTKEVHVPVFSPHRARIHSGVRGLRQSSEDVGHPVGCSISDGWRSPVSIRYCSTEAPVHSWQVRVMKYRCRVATQQHGFRRQASILSMFPAHYHSTT